MKPSNKKDTKLVQEKTSKPNKEPYQTPAIVYEGTISIRAGSPIPLTDPGDPFSFE